MRRVNRKTAAWCSGLLIILQMVIGPVAHPMPGSVEDADCDHASQHGALQLDGDCGQCPSAPAESPAGSQHDHPTPHAFCKCACPCGHTPALATPAIAILKPSLPAEVPGEPKGPAFSPPLFDLLRPPN